MPTIRVDSPVELGVFDNDPQGREAFVREQVRVRIQQKSPIYPKRSLGLEYAAVTNGPRGYPVAAVALANLEVGEGFPLWGHRYELTKRGKRLEFAVDGQEKPFRVSQESSGWSQFERHIDGLLLGAAHGCDAGDLPAAWRRDPASAV